MCVCVRRQQESMGLIEAGYKKYIKCRVDRRRGQAARVREELKEAKGQSDVCVCVRA